MVELKAITEENFIDALTSSWRRGRRLLYLIRFGALPRHMFIGNNVSHSEAMMKGKWSGMLWSSMTMMFLSMTSGT